MPFDTMEIERHLLRLLSGNKMQARMHVHSVKPEWFTGNRRMIWDIFHRIFVDTSSSLTDELLKAELEKLYPDPEVQADDRQRYQTEWTLIKNSPAAETADALIDKLKEKSRIDAISDICRRTIDAIKSGKPDEAAAILKGDSVKLDTNSGDKPLVEITDLDHMIALIESRKREPHKFAGIKIGFPIFDGRTGGLFPAEMTLVSAVTGVGKSTFLKQVGFNVARGEADHSDPTMRKPGRNVLHVTNEEHRDQVQMKYLALAANVDYLRIKNAQVDETEMKAILDAAERMRQPGWGRIFVKEVAQFSDISEIYRHYHELKQAGFDIGLIVLDYLDHLAPLQKSWSENDEQAKTAWDFKAMTIDLNVPGITATQAATIVDQRMERGQKFGKLNVYGSKRRIHASNTVIGIMVSGYDESQILKTDYNSLRETIDDCDRVWTAEVMKNRDGAPFQFILRHEVRPGRVTVATLAEVTAAKEADEKRKKAAKEAAKSGKDPKTVDVTPPRTPAKPSEVPQDASGAPGTTLTPSTTSEAPISETIPENDLSGPVMPFVSSSVPPKGVSTRTLELIRKSRERFESNL